MGQGRGFRSKSYVRSKFPTKPLLNLAGVCLQPPNVDGHGWCGGQRPKSGAPQTSLGLERVVRVAGLDYGSGLEAMSWSIPAVLDWWRRASDTSRAKP